MESLSKVTGVNLHEEHLMLCLEKGDSLSATIEDEFILILKKVLPLLLSWKSKKEKDLNFN